MAHEVWAVGDAYEAYVGRWGRLVAKAFLRWLDVAAGRHWLDVGCGNGALTATVLAEADPAQVLGVDPSEGFLADARAQIVDTRATFRAGDAQSLPLPDGRFHAVVSGLALNFVPDPGRAAAELDQARRFPLCRPDPLTALWTDAGLADVTVQAIDVPTVFANFDDYWTPFLGGQGAAPRICRVPTRRRPSRAPRPATCPRTRQPGRLHLPHRASLGGTRQSAR